MLKRMELWLCIGLTSAGLLWAASDEPPGTVGPSGSFFADGFECIDGCPSPSIDYLSSIHTVADCTDAGGSLVTIIGDPNGTELCRFNSGSCPQDWAWGEGWSTTIGEAASYVQPQIATFETTCNGVTYNWPAVSADSGSHGSGSHDFSNNSDIESSVCRVWQGSATQSPVLNGCDDPGIVSFDEVSSSDRCSDFGIPLDGFRVSFVNSGDTVLSLWTRNTSTVVAVAVRTQIGCY